MAAAASPLRDLFMASTEAGSAVGIAVVTAAVTTRRMALVGGVSMNPSGSEDSHDMVAKGLDLFVGRAC